VIEKGKHLIKHSGFMQTLIKICNTYGTSVNELAKVQKFNPNESVCISKQLYGSGINNIHVYVFIAYNMFHISYQ